MSDREKYQRAMVKWLVATWTDPEDIIKNYGVFYHAWDKQLSRMTDEELLEYADRCGYISHIEMLAKSTVD